MNICNISKLVESNEFSINMLNNMIKQVKRSLKYNKNTRLMMNDTTVKVITGKHFYDDKLQSYENISIVESCDLEYGEVIVLIQAF